MSDYREETSQLITKEMQTKDHIKALQRAEYEKLLSFRDSGKSCKLCSKKTQGRYGLVWCNFHNKQVKPYNICSHFQERSKKC